MAGAAQFEGHGDMAVERQHVLVQVVGLLHDFQRVAGVLLLPEEIAGGTPQGGHQGQG
ncbi:hypothetical protein D3C76_1850530 [compost metagenome]